MICHADIIKNLVYISFREKIVLFHHIFNKDEFELYGLGEIMDPDVPCKGRYKPSCDKNCVELIKEEDVFRICKKLLTL